MQAREDFAKLFGPEAEHAATDPVSRAPAELDAVDLPALSKKAGALPRRRRRQDEDGAAANDEAEPSGPLPAQLERVHGWVVLGQFAKGGLSLLYEVSHGETRQRALMKILKPEYRGADLHAERMLAEGKLLHKCAGNPYFCNVYDVGEHPRFGPYVIMELLHGSTLAEMIRKENARGRTFTVPIAVKLCITIAEALQTAHDQGIIHRDLKPDNIFIVQHANGDIEVKIIDWGAAKHDLSPRSTHVAPVVTALYMAPEQASRAEHVTAAADMYALGLVLLQLVWEHPFASKLVGGQLRLLDLIGMHVHEPLPVPPLHLVPPGLTKIAFRASAKKARDRYPSMSELADELRAFLTTPWKLEERPVEQNVPFRPTQLNARALEAGKTAPATPVRIDVPAEPPKKARAVPLEEVLAEPSLLVLAPDELRGKRFEIGSRGTIGRHPAVSALLLEHPTVSNVHVAYGCVQPDVRRPVYSVQNLSEVNPAFLKAQPLETGAWKPNEILELGDVRVVLLPAGSVTDRAGTLHYAPLPVEAAPERRAQPAPKREARSSSGRPSREIPFLQPSELPSLIVCAPAPLARKRFTLGLTNPIGRSADDAAIVLDDESVSRVHARLLLKDYKPLALDLVDAESTNGTFVIDGERRVPCVPRRAERVGAFSVLQLGDVRVMVAPAGRFADDLSRWITPREEAATKESGKVGYGAARTPKGTIVTPRRGPAKTADMAPEEPRAPKAKPKEPSVLWVAAGGLLVGICLLLVLLWLGVLPGARP